jgi:hypothetical protein
MYAFLFFYFITMVLKSQWARRSYVTLIFLLTIFSCSTILKERGIPIQKKMRRKGNTGEKVKP